MKKTSNPPSSKTGAKPMTKKRKKILDTAMEQLKKTRSQMDPAILKKIRGIIASNPKIMKGLGIDEMPDEKEQAVRSETSPKKNPQKAMDIETLLNKAKNLHAKKKSAAEAVEVNAQMRSKPQAPVRPTKPAEEKIDQAQNMEVLAKLMQLKPSEIENIKSVILKSKN